MARLVPGDRLGRHPIAYKKFVANLLVSYVFEAEAFRESRLSYLLRPQGQLQQHGNREVGSPQRP